MSGPSRTSRSGGGAGSETLRVLAPAGATPAIDLAQGTVYDVTLNANAVLSIANPPAGASSFMLFVRQDATGNRTITWPAGIKWSGGVAPVLSTGAGKLDTLSFVSVDGGTSWAGSLAGADLR